MEDLCCLEKEETSGAGQYCPAFLSYRKYSYKAILCSYLDKICLARCAAPSRLAR